MGFVNKVMLMGNTTRDAELRTLPSGTTVCEFGLATNRVYKTTSGEERQETVFVDCTAFGRTGEVLAEYCPKGRQLFVEGRLHFHTWEDQGGAKRSKLSVIVENFQFIGAREGVATGNVQHELPLNGEKPQPRSPVPAVQKIGTAGTARRGNEQRSEVVRRESSAPHPTTDRAVRSAPPKASRLRGVGAGSAAGTATAVAGGRDRLNDLEVVDRMAEEEESASGVDADLPF